MMQSFLERPNFLASRPILFLFRKISPEFFESGNDKTLATLFLPRYFLFKDLESLGEAKTIESSYFLGRIARAIF